MLGIGLGLSHVAMMGGDPSMKFDQDFLQPYGAPMAACRKRGPVLPFSRGSGATQTNELGKMVWAPHNLILQSEDLNTTWSKTRSTVSSDAVAGPFSGTFADTIAEDGTATATHYISQSVTLILGAVYVYSFYAKASNRDWLALAYSESGNQRLAYFDLANGVIGNISGWGSASITNVGNGWYRCEATTRAIVTISNYIITYAAEAESESAYNGLTQDSIYAYGAQINRDTAQAYWPTTTVAYQGPRFDHDKDGNRIGLRKEIESENLVAYTQPYDDTLIFGGSTNATTREAVTWLGFFEYAAEINYVSSTAYAYITVSITDTNTYRATVYARATDSSVIAPDVGSSAGDFRFFIQNATLSDLTQELVDASIGLYKITMKCVATATDSAANFGCLQYADQDGKTIQFTGLQLEAGNISTSHIPANGVTVTRAADVCSTTDVSWLSQLKGTFYAEASILGVFTSTSILFEISDNSDSDRLSQSITSASKIRSVLKSGGGGAQVIQETAGGIVPNTPFKLAVAYDLNDFNHVINGVLGAGDSLLALPFVTPITKFVLGAQYSGGSGYNGHIRSLKYRDKRDPNAFMQSEAA